jgi:hypothetical protein
VLEKKKKRAAVVRGAWKPEPMTDITEEHSLIRPFGAQFCPGPARAPLPSLISLSIGASPSAIACPVAASDRERKP